jgi:hypothetical protein
MGLRAAQHQPARDCFALPVELQKLQLQTLSSRR